MPTCMSRVMKMLRFMMKPLQLLQSTCFDIIINFKMANSYKIYLAVSLVVGMKNNIKPSAVVIMISISSTVVFCFFCYGILIQSITKT